MFSMGFAALLMSVIDAVRIQGDHRTLPARVKMFGNNQSITDAEVEPEVELMVQSTVTVSRRKLIQTVGDSQKNLGPRKNVRMYFFDYYAKKYF